MEALRTALNALAFGVVLFERSGRITLLNNAAKQISKETFGVCRREQLLDLVCSPDRKNFQSMVEGACSCPPPRNLQPLLLHDAKGKPISVIFALSLCAPNDSDHASLQFAAVLFVRSLNSQTLVTKDTLRSLFRMPEAEACVVTAPYAGATLTAARRNLGKSVSTPGPSWARHSSRPIPGGKWISCASLIG